MQEREQAKRLYVKVRENENLDENAQADLKRTIKNLVKRSLNSVDHKSRFVFPEFPMMIAKTAKCGKFDKIKTCEAFILLERYLLLLLTFPWKTEFHKLKTYSGFFQCKIKSHLEDPELVFKRIGFREDHSNNSILICRGYLDLNLISDVSFECVVASIECELISEYHRCIAEKGGDIGDAIIFRLEGRHPDFSKTKPCEHADYLYTKNDVACVAPGRALQQRGIRHVNIPTGVPFIDEDFGANEAEVAPSFQVGTVDDHMLASLQKLKTQQPRSHVGASSNSEEWSFVRNKLENKYGKRYYDGERGDFINSNSRHDGSTPVTKDRDYLSDEGIDIRDDPRLLTKTNSNVLSRRTDSNLPMDTASKSFMTSGYRSGQYSQSTVYPAQNSAVLTCDVAPLSPGAEPSSVVTHSSGYATQSPVPRVLPPTRQHVPMPKLTTTGDSKHLANIERLSRGEASGAFRMDVLKHRGLNLIDEAKSNKRWKCHACTMDNSPDSKVCGICHKSRVNPLDVDGPQVGDSVRVCSKCTLENKPGSVVCVACDTELVPTNINTYV